MTASPQICSSCHTPLPEAAAFCWVCGQATPTSTSMAGSTATRPSLESPAAVVDTRRRLERTLGSNFTVGDLVGRGGFAEVFKVRDERLKRDIAVKVLSPELVVNQTMLTRFRREAEAIAALRHSGIVPIYDIGEASGIAYIMMPLIKGSTLRQHLEEKGVLPVAEARRILKEVGDALRVAHEAGLVHRDIKPENIMLEGPKEQVLVMDFGIAKAIDPEATGMTTSGLIVGTPHYMSPEQASGEPVDARSDQYSLAVLGYRMTTGQHPFEAETTRALLYKQVFETAPDAMERVADIPKSLSDALKKGMSKDPADRYATIDDFVAAVMETGSAPAEVAPPAGKHPAREKKGAKQDDPKPAATPAAKSDAKPAKPKAAAGTPVKGFAVKAGLGLAATIALVLVATKVIGGRDGTPAVPDSVAVQDSAAAPGTGVAGTGEEAEAPVAPRRNRPAQSAAAGATPTDTRPVTTTRTSRTSYATCRQAVAASAWADAAPLCQIEADQGQMEAQYALARMYDRGNGVGQDQAVAADWYGKAADAGSGDAAFRLAQMLDTGEGIPADARRAVNLYVQAARRNNVPAMRIYAQKLETGVGIAKNESEAVNWYRRAGAAGDALAQFRLGQLYAEGKGVGKNETLAVDWFRRAAEAGNPEAQYAMALAYLGGRGVAASDSIGAMWLDRSARQNYGPAVELKSKRPSP